jgi:hypothetical protein
MILSQTSRQSGRDQQYFSVQPLKKTLKKAVEKDLSHWEINF